MIATFISLSVIKYSMIPRLQFDIDITNDSDNQQILIFGWSGGLSLQYPQYLQISDLSTGFEFVSIDAKAKSKIKTSCEVSHEKLDIIEDLRKGENLQIAINLNILNSLIPKSAPPPHGISQIRCDSVWVKLTCPPKIGPLKMRDSCKITTGGSKSENEKIFGGAGISYSSGG